MQVNISQLMKDLDKELNAALNAGKTDLALHILQTKIAPLNADHPHNPDILYYTGTALMLLKMPGVAIPLLLRCLDYSPRHWQAMNNVGCCYKQLGKNERAKEFFFDAMRHGGSRNPDLMNNIGGVFTTEGEPERAIIYARAAHEYAEKGQPTAQYTWNLALALMELEDWGKGFPLYESGILSKDRGIKRYMTRHDKLIPLWDRTPGKRVILCSEQGLGDNILFASAFEYAHKDIRFLLDCHPRLYTLFRRSFPDIEMYNTYKAEPPYAWSKDREFDATGGIGSLLGLYHRSVIDKPHPYLVPDRCKVEYWRQRLKSTGPGPYIGFSWKGGTPYSGIWSRSFSPNAYDPLFALGGQWFSVQYDTVSVQGLNLSKYENVHHWADAVQTFDYDDTAAFIKALDYIISPPQAIIHLAGAVGVPCMVMVPFERAWRYPRGDRMYWYSSVNQIHKPKGVTWSDFIAGKGVQHMRQFMILHDSMKVLT